MRFADCAAHGKTIETVGCAAVDVGVWNGGMFRGPCRLRIRPALPRSRVEAAFDRLSRDVFLP